MWAEDSVADRPHSLDSASQFWRIRSHTFIDCEGPPQAAHIQVSRRSSKLNEDLLYLKQHRLITAALVPFVCTADKRLICRSPRPRSPTLPPNSAVCCSWPGSSAEVDEQDRGNPGMWGRRTPSDKAAAVIRSDPMNTEEGNAFAAPLSPCFHR